MFLRISLLSVFVALNLVVNSSQHFWQTFKPDMNQQQAPHQEIKQTNTFNYQQYQPQTNLPIVSKYPQPVGQPFPQPIVTKPAVEIQTYPQPITVSPLMASFSPVKPFVYPQPVLVKQPNDSNVAAVSPQPIPSHPTVGYTASSVQVVSGAVDTVGKPFQIQQPILSYTGEVIVENTVGGIVFDCVGKPTGHWRDTQFCDVYHACVHGYHRKTYTCPIVGERTYFDEATQR